MNQLNALMTLEGFDNLFTFAKAHEAGVNKHTRELGTNCFVDERSSNC